MHYHSVYIGDFHFHFFRSLHHINPTAKRGAHLFNVINRKNMTTEIQEQLNRIERNSLLAAKNMFSLEEASLFLNMSRSFIYKLTYRHKIPFYRPGGKQIYFDRGEVEAWMKQNRVNTRQEAEQQAAMYVAGHKKGGAL